MNDISNDPKAARLFKFDRLEFAGSLGDLGTLLPLSIGMIIMCGMNATNVLMLIGFFYILSGVYFRVPTAVQPMKAIGAYAISVGLAPVQIAASCVWMGALLLFLGGTGLIEVIRKHTPKSVIRGIQLALGVVLLIKGLGLMMDPDPGLAIQSVGPVSMGVVLGIAGMILTFVLLNNAKIPAALVVLALGIVAGLFLGKPIDTGALNLGFHVPEPLPYGWPSVDDFLYVLPLVVLPQIPMTIGNAVFSR